MPKYKTNNQVWNVQRSPMADGIYIAGGFIGDEFQCIAIDGAEWEKNHDVIMSMLCLLKEIDKTNRLPSDNKKILSEYSYLQENYEYYKDRLAT